MIDLFEKFPILRRIVKLRAFSFLVIVPNLLFFYLFILAGLFGTPVGNRNIIIIFVWILWWVLLISFMVPFGSRIWCTVCPLPVIGEWVQRLSLIRKREGETIKGFKAKFFGLNKPWPKRFQNIWLQNAGFLILACFSGFLVTRPIVSVIVLGGMILLAVILALIYRMRSFCMYLCPVSGFLGLYAMTSKLALRRKNPEVCRAHKGRECFLGSSRGYPCPWFQNVCTMERNNYCGLCFECVKNCEENNIGLFWRRFCGDKKIKGFDEAWKAFIMLTLAFVYSVNLLGPWGIFKDWANFTETGKWQGFLLVSLAVILLCTGIVPAIYGFFVAWARKLSGSREISLRNLFISYSYCLVPMGLLCWVAFSIPLIMINGSYIISVISDPFGWGWNLFGTANFHWRPFLPEWVPYIQVPLLLLGLFYSIRSTYEIGTEIFSEKIQATRSLIPISIFLVGITIGFLRLFVG
jgi:ferredoxin